MGLDPLTSLRQHGFLISGKDDARPPLGRRHHSHPLERGLLETNCVTVDLNHLRDRDLVAWMMQISHSVSAVSKGDSRRALLSHLWASGVNPDRDRWIWRSHPIGSAFSRGYPLNCLFAGDVPTPYASGSSSISMRPRARPSMIGATRFSLMKDMPVVRPSLQEGPRSHASA